MYRDWNRWNDEGFTFLELMYLYPRFIRCRRCFFDNWCSSTALIFIVADALFRPMYLQLALLWTCRCFSVCLACINCIYILLFLGFEDTSFANFTSASHIFYDLRMLLIEILHPQSALSRPCGYSTVKMCILNPIKSIIADISPQYPLSCYLLHNLSQYIVYKKIDIRNSSEYGVSIGDT